MSSPHAEAPGHEPDRRGMVANGEGGTVRVLQLQRLGHPGQHSIERAFQSVREHLPADTPAEVFTSSFPSRGLLPRLRAVLEARRVARASGADVLHVVGDTYFLTLGLDGHRTVVTIHDAEFLERSRGAKRLLYRWLWLRLPARRAAFVVAPSRRTRDDLVLHARIPAPAIRVIPIPLVDDFSPIPPFDGIEPVVLQIGTQHNKNVAGLASALDGMRCRVRILGPVSDDLRATLDAHHISYTAATGLTDAEVREEYRRCDVVAVVSTFEGFGMAVIEAQASGRPVVASALSPLDEVSGEAACFVDPADPASIRAGIDRVLHDADYRRELVEGGLRNVARFDATRIADEYAAVYREVAARNAPTRRASPA